MQEGGVINDRASACMIHTPLHRTLNKGASSRLRQIEREMPIGVEGIAARWLRAKTSSKHNQEVLYSIILTIVNKAEVGNRAKNIGNTIIG